MTIGVLGMSSFFFWCFIDLWGRGGCIRLFFFLSFFVWTKRVSARICTYHKKETYTYTYIYRHFIQESLPRIRYANPDLDIEVVKWRKEKNDHWRPELALTFGSFVHLPRRKGFFFVFSDYNAFCGQRTARRRRLTWTRKYRQLSLRNSWLSQAETHGRRMSNRQVARGCPSYQGKSYMHRSMNLKARRGYPTWMNISRQIRTRFRRSDERRGRHRIRSRSTPARQSRRNRLLLPPYHHRRHHHRRHPAEWQIERSPCRYDKKLHFPMLYTN